MIEPQIGDYIEVTKGTFPDYPIEIFMVVDRATWGKESFSCQIKLQPLSKIGTDDAIWVVYQADIYKIINSSKLIHLFDGLYAP